MTAWISGGFVGRHLVEAFDEVCAPSRAEVDGTGPAAALVRALRAGERFTVWEGRHTDTLAALTPASDAARLIARIAEGGHRGVLHCCGGESVSRRELALRALEVFGLHGKLLEWRPAPEQPWPVPYDTRLDATATAAALGVELPDLEDQLRGLERSLSCTT